MGQKIALVLGGHGFIGHHLARRLKSEGYSVDTVDIKEYEYGDYDFCDDSLIRDLREFGVVNRLLSHNDYDEIYQLAADMGGAQFVFTGEHDADIIHNSLQINLNVAKVLAETNFKGKLFYSSSACMYPQELQKYEKADITRGWTKDGLKESDAYPGNPDSEYGWEKLMSERLYLAYARNYDLDIRIARFHNVYGEEGTYQGGREKSPAAMCRKVIESQIRSDFAYEYERSIEIWGDGEQTRSFLYIQDCVDAIRLLMESDFKQPINIGSEEIVSINQLAKLAIEFSGKEIQIKHDLNNKALGVRGRNSNNDLIRQVLKWEPKYTLRQGLEKTYRWIEQQMK